MSELRKVAQQVLKTWDTEDWFDPDILRAALAQERSDVQPEPEPVCDKDPRGCWNVRCQLGKVCKNTTPQRQPLTKEQIMEAIKHISHNEMSAFSIAKAIEEAHGIE